MLSPLAEANTKSLDYYFSKDPELLTHEDRLELVNALRAQRKNWLAAESAGKRAPKAPKLSATVNAEDVDPAKLGL